MKYKKKQIFIGLILAALLLSVLFLAKRKSRLTPPQRAVSDSLKMLQAPSSQSEDLLAGLIAAQGAGSGRLTQEAADAFRLFYQTFSFRILGGSSSGEEASVKVEAAGPDGRQLALLIRKRQLELAYAESGDREEGSQEESDPYRMMKDLLQEGSIRKSHRVQTLTVRKGTGGWFVVSDQALKDLLTGGFTDAFRDPDLLTPEDILEVYFGRYQSMTVQEWEDALQVEDLFSLSSGSSSSQDQVRTALFRKLSDLYSYELGPLSVSGSSAQASVKVTSLDLSAVLSSYRESLIAYSQDPSFLQEESAGVSEQKTGLLAEAIQQTDERITSELRVSLVHDQDGWQLKEVPGLTDALLGHLQAAVSSFSVN